MTHSIHHSFSTDLAIQYSIEEAVMIHHFQFWISLNKRQRRHCIDARTWSYQTLDDIAAHFPYWDRNQVSRIVNKLVEKKVLIKGNYNRSKMDRTVWYAFTDEPYFISDKCISQNREMEISKPQNADLESETAIPDTKPYSIPDAKESSHSLAKESGPICEKEKNSLEGKFENKVFVTHAQYERLTKKLGSAEIVEQYADRLYRWSFNNAAKFKKFKRHDMVIEDWFDRAQSQFPQHTGMPQIRSGSALNDAQNKNWTQNQAVVEFLKKESPNKAGGLYWFLKEYLLRDKKDTSFALCGYIDNKDFIRQLNKHLKVKYIPDEDKCLE